MGRSLVSLLLPAFQLVGTTLLALTMLVLGMTLGLGLSWLKVVDRTGAISLKCFGYAGEAWERHREKQREEEETRHNINQRKEALDNFIEKDAKRPLIEITPIREDEL